MTLSGFEGRDPSELPWLTTVDGQSRLPPRWTPKSGQYDQLVILAGMTSVAL